MALEAFRLKGSVTVPSTFPSISKPVRLRNLHVNIFSSNRKLILGLARIFSPRNTLVLPLKPKNGESDLSFGSLLRTVLGIGARILSRILTILRLWRRVAREKSSKLSHRIP